MSRYNQQYSEIDNIPFREIIFFVRLAEAEDKYNKQLMDKNKRNIKR